MKYCELNHTLEDFNNFVIVPVYSIFFLDHIQKYFDFLDQSFTFAPYESSAQKSKSGYDTLFFVPDFVSIRYESAWC